MLDTASISEEKLKRTPIDVPFNLADQAILERKNSLLTLLEITHWIALMEEVTKKSKDPILLEAAVSRVNELLGLQTSLHDQLSETEVVYENGEQITRKVSGQKKFTAVTTDIASNQPLFAKRLHFETKSRSDVLESYRDRILLQIIQIPGSKDNPFEYIDLTTRLLEPFTPDRGLENLPDGYGAMLKEGLYAIFQAGIQSTEPEKINQALERIRKIRDNQDLLIQTDRLYKTVGISIIFGRKQEKKFPYFTKTASPNYVKEASKMKSWFNRFYILPLQAKLGQLR
ncbi:hypothetical protein KBD71_03850 [Candidatus Woesebacteria bacterium]|nr:hypothetical protein [Candidatus Woesebacteria bacterium]